MHVSGVGTPSTLLTGLDPLKTSHFSTLAVSNVASVEAG